MLAIGEESAGLMSEAPEASSVSAQARAPGRLYVVATPIGNLQDITLRAIKVLGEVDYVACEDTRVTSKLLAHFGLRKPMLSYYRPQERRKMEAILKVLSEGRAVALVTDAGTPGVSDPGALLVAEAHRRGIPVEPIPGVFAGTAAFSAAGFESSGFWFCGFLPGARGERRRCLQTMARPGVPVILYVAPHDLRHQLEEILTYLGDRQLLFARELTKVFEEVRRTTVGGLLRGLPERVRGECVLVIEPGEIPAEAVDVPVAARFHALLDQGHSRSQAIKILSQEMSVPKRRVIELLGEEAG